MKWVKESIRSIPEAHEPDGDSRILLKSKLFWLSDIQMKLDELTELSESSADGQYKRIVRQRYRKESDGPGTLFYQSEKLGWLPVLAVEHYPIVCRNVTRITDESIWLNLQNRHRNHRQRQYFDTDLSIATKGRYFGKYMATQYHLNAGLMEKFYLWIEDHRDEIEREEQKLEKILMSKDETDQSETSGSSSKRRHCRRVSPQRSCNSLDMLLDDDLSVPVDTERGVSEDKVKPLDNGFPKRRLRELEDQNFVLATRVSALECRNIALEAQVRSMMQALKDAKLLS